MPRQKTSRFRHAFRFKLADDNNQVITSWAKVRIPSKGVELMLKPEHVQASRRKGGIGNTQTCSMALCAKAHQNSFPHPVEGYVDWQYRRAYVVSKVGRSTGMPTECFVYDHNDPIAHLNDSKGGQDKLLKMLEKKGEMVVRLRPPKPAPSRPGRARGRNTGERSQPKSLGVGARRRFAVALAGGVPMN
jgi:hypothetical protein